MSIIILIISILLILSVIVQPSLESGFTGQSKQEEKLAKRGFELFIYRFTIILITLFFFTIIISNYMSLVA